MNLVAEAAWRQTRGAGKQPAETGRVVEAERIGDGRDRQVGIDEIAPRLAKAAEFLPARTASFEFGPEVPLLINVDQRPRRRDLPERG